MKTEVEIVYENYLRELHYSSDQFDDLFLRKGQAATFIELFHIELKGSEIVDKFVF